MFDLVLTVFKYYFIISMIAGTILAIWFEVFDAFGRKMNGKKYTKEEIERSKRFEYKGMI